MRYEELSQFIAKRMRMAHIYQPLMLMSLLKHGGRCPTKVIAKAILGRDESQLEYYENITNNMVGRVLRKHGIVERDKDGYKLVGFETLTEKQASQLVTLCQEKLNEYIGKRGDHIWLHRKQSAGYISGTLRYEVLKQAKFHCELCGVSADLKALEVDHIKPRNKGGTDDVDNLQALCYSCNSMKRDRDDTDFREIRESYRHNEKGCPFCELPRKRIIAENKLAYAIRDGYPVTDLHTLIIPKRHVVDYFGMGRPEVNACNRLFDELRSEIMKADQQVVGFNIGTNAGEAAGQTVFHCHMHLIPRRKGDVENPRGGVRHVIPGKGDYVK
jgi:diadenosine tetraphosphate (Ap4A) HIT family hydrolase